MRLAKFKVDSEDDKAHGFHVTHEVLSHLATGLWHLQGISRIRETLWGNTSLAAVLC